MIGEKYVRSAPVCERSCRRTSGGPYLKLLRHSAGEGGAYQMKRSLCVIGRPYLHEHSDQLKQSGSLFLLFLLSKTRLSHGSLFVCTPSLSPLVPQVVWQVLLHRDLQEREERAERGALLGRCTDGCSPLGGALLFARGGGALLYHTLLPPSQDKFLCIYFKMTKMCLFIKITVAVRSFHCPSVDLTDKTVQWWSDKRDTSCFPASSQWPWHKGDFPTSFQ